MNKGNASGFWEMALESARHWMHGAPPNVSLVTAPSVESITHKKQEFRLGSRGMAITECCDVSYFNFPPGDQLVEH